MPYRLSSRAEQDLDNVWFCVAEDASPTTADRLIDDLVDRVDRLADSPGWDVSVRSSDPAFAPSASRIMSSITGTMATC